MALRCVQGTEIQGTFFNDEATKFFDMIQPQQVYFISGGRISLAKKRFTSITNDHAITFNRTTQISLAPQDSRIKMVSYKFVPINRIAELEKGARVDVIGYVRNPQEIREITTRSGSNTTKRDMDVVDDSGSSIRLTLWGYVVLVACCPVSAMPLTDASVGSPTHTATRPTCLPRL